MIKSENGRLRAYVQLTVRNRDEIGFVEEARRVVDQKVKLPPGMYIEWSGQFEHQLRARQTLRLVFPAVIAVIVLILYLTYHSVVDTVLMMTSVLVRWPAGRSSSGSSASTSAWPSGSATSPASAWRSRPAS